MRHARLLIPMVIFTLVSLWITLHPAFGIFDSLAYWGSVNVFLRGGDPYDLSAIERQLSEIGSHILASQHVAAHPWTLAFILPLCAWPFATAKFLISFSTLSIYYLCIQRLQRLWRPIPRGTTLLMWAYIPFLATLYFGQFSAFLSLGTVLILEWLQSTTRQWWKWAFAMALFAVKPQGFVVIAPLLMLEFARTAARKDTLRVTGFFVLLVVLASPLLTYIPEWIASSHLSTELRTSTLSTYARDAGAFFGYDSPLWLWALPLTTLATLLAWRVRITDPSSFLLLLILSQLTAPYLWVYDSCALMPLFYALIGAVTIMETPQWRLHLGIIFASVAIFPIYMTIDPDFSFMRMHNVCLGIAAVLLLPGLRRYVRGERSCLPVGTGESARD